MHGGSRSGHCSTTTPRSASAVCGMTFLVFSKKARPKVTPLSVLPCPFFPVRHSGLPPDLTVQTHANVLEYEIMG